MLYKEGPVPVKEEAKLTHHSEPYSAPTHAGGLFAINRDWFKELGWYDSGLWVWGAENFELSFKVWMCGGRSVWVPCSRVSHVYRGHSCSSCHPGSLGDRFAGVPTTLRNYKRVVETWFDEEYKEYFYTREPLARFIDMGDITEQLKLKKEKKCKSFSWFMKEVAYDVLEMYPPLPPNKHWGILGNLGSNLCLDTYGRHPPEHLGTSECYVDEGDQLFRLNTQGQLTSGEWCMMSDRREEGVTISYCDLGSVDGPWVYKTDAQQVYNTVLKRCLTVHPETEKLLLSKCDRSSPHHRWQWGEITPHWAEEEK